MINNRALTSSLMEQFKRFNVVTIALCYTVNDRN